MRPKRLLLCALLAAGFAPLIGGAAEDNEEPTASFETPSPSHGRYLLMDGNGRAVSNGDFPGRFQLISFGYTSCPDVCPTTLAEMAAILTRLGKEAGRLQTLFITLDPERDTASVLQHYVGFFDPRIMALSGPPALIRRAADNFLVRYEIVREPGAPAEQYAVDHSAGMFLLGPDGRYIRKFAYALPAAEIGERIREIMIRLANY